MKSFSVSSMVMTLLLVSHPCSSQKNVSKKENKTVKEKVVALLENLPTKNIETVEKYVSDKKYIQHNNPHIADGKQVFERFVKQGLISKSKVIRAFQDGDYAVAHMDYDFMGNKIAFDVIRFK